MERRAGSQKIMSRAALWSRDSTPGYLHEENKNTDLERCLHPQVPSSVTYQSQEVRYVFTNRQMSEVVVYIICMYIYIPGEGNGTPLQYSCLENSTARGAWWATVRGIAKSRTRLRD